MSYNKSLLVIVFLCTIIIVGLVTSTAVWEDQIKVDAGSRFKRFVDCNNNLHDTQLTLDPPDETSVDIAWNKVKDANRYEVRVLPFSTCVDGVGETRDTKAVISNLDAGTKYDIILTAFDDLECNFTTKQSVTTNKGNWNCEDSIVLGSVTNIEMLTNESTSNKAFIQWTPLRHAEYYDYTVDPPPKNGDASGRTTGSSALLFGLIPAYTYTVTITPGRGDSKKGKPKELLFTTQLDPPNDFTVQNITSNYFLVSWNSVRFALHYETNLTKIDENGFETLIHTENSSEIYHYFDDLQPSTLYRVTIRSLNDMTFSDTIEAETYTKLPTPQDITISNVTNHGVTVSWTPVEGATGYRIIVKNNADQTIVGKINVDKPTHLVNNLKAASEYILEIYALNEHTTSLKGEKQAFSRLMPVTCLSVDKRYIQDTSIVIRWAKVDGAYWYEVGVDPPTDAPEELMDEDGEVNKREWRRVSNLKPGIKYTFTVVAKNHKLFDTKSIPVSISQFTKLSRPQNLNIDYMNIEYNKMQVSWDPVPHAEDKYFLVVFDCSISYESDAGAFTPVTEMPSGIEEMTAECQLNSRYWGYKFAREKKILLQCGSGDVDNTIQAWRNLKALPDNAVLGQGQIGKTEVTLTNMRPGNQYEMVLVAGESETQSEATVIHKYTKLPRPMRFEVDKRAQTSRVIVLSWLPTDGAVFYEVTIKKTPNPYDDDYNTNGEV